MQYDDVKGAAVLKDAGSYINAFSQRDWINLSGTQYDYASAARYDVEVLYVYDNLNLKDVTYNVILDKYGCAIGLEKNEDPDQYVFLTGIEQGYSNLATRLVDANVIHLDGTMKTVKVDTKKSTLATFAEPSQANTWCVYRADSDGVYTLTQVAMSPRPTTDKAAQWKTNVTGDNETVIDQKHISLPSYSTKADGTVDYSAAANSVTYGDDKTVYLNVELDNIPAKDFKGDYRFRRIIDDVTSVVIGHRNVKISVKNCPDAVENGNTYAAPAMVIKDDNAAPDNKPTSGGDTGVATGTTVEIKIESKTAASQSGTVKLADGLDKKVVGEAKNAKVITEANGEVRASFITSPTLLMSTKAKAASETASFVFNVASGYTAASPTYDITGAKLADDAADSAKLTDNTVTAGSTTTTPKLYAEGGKPVTITIKGVAKTPVTKWTLTDEGWGSTKKYIVSDSGTAKVQDILGTSNDESTIEVIMSHVAGAKTEISSSNPTGATAAAGKYEVPFDTTSKETVLLQLDVKVTKGNNNADAYKLSIAITDEDDNVVSTFTKEFDAPASSETFTWTGMEAFRMSKNLVIKAENVKVERLTKPEVLTTGDVKSSYDAATKVLTLVFDQDMDMSTISDKTITAKAPTGTTDKCTVMSVTTKGKRTVKIQLADVGVKTSGTDGSATVVLSDGIKGENGLARKTATVKVVTDKDSTEVGTITKT